MTKLTSPVRQIEPDTLDAFQFECDKQRRLHDELITTGFEIADDPANLKQHIGTVQEIGCFCEMHTPRLLCKLYVEGTEKVEHSFHLVPLYQLVKWNYVIPQPGQYFTAKYVIGVRRVSEKQFVPALRLPLK